ncbi:hypothetical protein AAU61_15800 [Desulfocarbo indianensis]|nr:hypothetical protein AAU61_15800 [Desulfocarbo indianensis]
MAAPKSLLVFPPIWLSTSFPYLSLPCLAAALRGHGYPVEVLDLNLGFAHRLASREAGSALLQAMLAQGRPPSVQQRSLAAWLAPPKVKGRLQPGQYPGLLHLAATLRGLPPGLSASHAAHFLSGIWSNQVTLAQLMRLCQNPEHHLAAPYLEQSFGEALHRHRPHLVGLSVANSTQLMAAFALAGQAREILGRRVTIVMGGPWCTLMARTLSQAPELFDLLDYVAVSAGEAPLLAILRGLAQGRGPSRPEGLIHRDAQGLVRQTPPAPLSCRHLPPPDFNGLDLAGYSGFSTHSLTIPLEASRGCYWGRCRFCNYCRINPGYQAKGAPQVLHEIGEALRAYPGAGISFIDDVLSPARLGRLAGAILERGWRFAWSASARAGKGFTLELCRALRAAGCRLLFFGLESGSERLLKLMDKGFGLAEARRTVANCHRAGIVAAANLIVGLPTESRQEAEQTMEFSRELGLSRQYLTVSEFSFARGSRFFQDAARYVDDPGLLASMRRGQVQTTFPLPRDYEVSQWLTAKEAP